MNRVVEFFAPKAPLDYVVKWAILFAAINIANFLAEAPKLGRDNYDWLSEAWIILLVGGPFLVLALAMLGHQRKLQDRLISLAATDVLTGLRNRRAFLADASKAHSAGDGGALILFDADHFKRINDTFGHDVGDLCLCKIAEHLKSQVRSVDVVGRLGGEEFGIYLCNASIERARAVGERLCQGFLLDEREPDVRLRLTLSAGAVLARAGVTIEQGLTIADRALYLAKQAGRARIIFAPA